MRKITEITNSPNQTCQLVLDTNDIVDFKMYFLETQSSWYFDFTYNNLVCNGNKVVLSANILRSFKNIIPFGIMFLSDDSIAPYKIDDFSTERVGLYLLNQDDVNTIETEVFLN